MEQDDGYFELEDLHAVRDDLFELYAKLNCTIVGIQYYTGVVHAGEYVNLVREPHNPYDSNAIRVDNMTGTQVGHIKRTQAECLAFLMDMGAQAPRIEASIPVEPSGRGYQIIADVALFGLPEHRNMVNNRLAAYEYVFPDPNRRKSGSGASLPGSPKGKGKGRARGGGGDGGGASNVVGVRQLDPIKTQRELDDLFERQLAEEDPASLPLDAATSAAPLLLTPLLNHQALGVAWMAKREREGDAGGSSGLPPFWERRVENGRPVFYNDITASAQATPPQPVRGGVLADDMGLGKTLQILSIILANPPEDVNYHVKAEAADAAAAAAGSASVKAEPHAASAAADESGNGTAAPAAKIKKGKQRAAIGPPAAASAASVAADDVVDLTFSEPQPRGTLVVCPLSVLWNWENQIQEHIRPGLLKVYTYHGSSRVQDEEFLASCDVVITTYSTLASEAPDAPAAAGSGSGGGSATKTKKRRRVHGVLALPWHRVVLDEASQVRNPKTRAFRACSQIQSARRWCVTGTPLHNKAEDVQSLFSFLGLAPVNDRQIFTRAIGRPIREGDERGLSRMRVLMRTVCLRRTKALLSLPPRTVELQTIALDETTREAYDWLYGSARAAFGAVLLGGDEGAMFHWKGVLECIQRLRQVCCSRAMVPPERLAAAKQVMEEMTRRGVAGGRGGTGKEQPLSAEDARRLFGKLQALLQEEEGTECSICMEISVEQLCLLRQCGHAFCQVCLQRTLNGAATGKCPFCRVDFSKTDILRQATISKTVADADAAAAAAAGGGDGAAAAAAAAAEDPAAMSPKVVALLENLRTIRDESRGDKAVVFSQYTSFLDIIDRHLEEEGFHTARIDGSKSARRRREALESFARSAPDSPQVMLVSLHSGGMGINLTAANHIFLVDLWWTPAAEEQAMDRVHRIGQTKPVRVVRFCAADTIEEKILEIQDAKRALGAGALRRLTAEEARRARAAELRKLFDLEVEEPST